MRDGTNRTTQARSIAPLGSGASFHSASYQSALQRLDRFACDDTAPILLQGESGTGKTSLARRVHAQSPRCNGPFQHIVLSALDDGVACSELFGHVAGAFTDARHTRAGLFASANGGTLFLDEIGKSARDLQAKLLHAIEYGEIRPVGSDRVARVNVRIVAATNVPLDDLVESGAFLDDLRARLTTFRIVLPPLRERRADIPALVHEAVGRHAAPAGYTDVIPVVDEDLMAALRAAAWPNNLRELDATVHRILVEAAGAPRLTLGHCLDELAYLTGASSSRRLTQANIAAALDQSGSISGAARMLGVDRKTLRTLRARGG
jgi:DNA-binding NtrC family response regulator